MNCIWILLLLFCCGNHNNGCAVATNDCGTCNHHHNCNTNSSCNHNCGCNTNTVSNSSDNCNSCNNCDTCNTCGTQRGFSYGSYPVLDNCDCN